MEATEVIKKQTSKLNMAAALLCFNWKILRAFLGEGNQVVFELSTDASDAIASMDLKNAESLDFVVHARTWTQHQARLKMLIKDLINKKADDN